ncbi:MAG: hypothetical protein MZV64_27850 [Ignavibacteriales bacterium]|nr:hypothetical protein [Ignavibacteriales bacterium]
MKLNEIFLYAIIAFIALNLSGYSNKLQPINPEAIQSTQASWEGENGYKWPEAISKGKPLIIYFYTRQTAVACVSFKPVLNRFKNEYGRRFIFFPVDANRAENYELSKI